MRTRIYLGVLPDVFVLAAMVWVGSSAVRRGDALSALLVGSAIGATVMATAIQWLLKKVS